MIAISECFGRGGRWLVRVFARMGHSVTETILPSMYVEGTVVIEKLSIKRGT
jgi:hypothetical protein